MLDPELFDPRTQMFFKFLKHNQVARESLLLYTLDRNVGECLFPILFCVCFKEMSWKMPLFLSVSSELGCAFGHQRNA